MSFKIKKAVKTGGAFLDLRELVKGVETGKTGNICLVIFRIREHLPSEKPTGYEGINLPVIADAVIASGPRRGEVFLGEKFFGGITSSLRGVKNPNLLKGEKPQPPTTEPGDVILVRVKLVNENKSNEGAVGDEPSDIETDAVQAWADTRGDALFEPANGVAEQREPVAAAASSGGGSKPWDK